MSWRKEYLKYIHIFPPFYFLWRTNNELFFFFLSSIKVDLQRCLPLSPDICPPTRNISLLPRRYHSWHCSLLTASYRFCLPLRHHCCKILHPLSSSSLTYWIVLFFRSLFPLSISLYLLRNLKYSQKFAASRVIQSTIDFFFFFLFVFCCYVT